jgi:hypothetical protein
MRASTSNVKFSESQRTPFSNSVLFPIITRLKDKNNLYHFPVQQNTQQNVLNREITKLNKNIIT